MIFSFIDLKLWILQIFIAFNLLRLSRSFHNLSLASCLSIFENGCYRITEGYTVALKTVCPTKDTIERKKSHLVY